MLDLITFLLIMIPISLPEGTRFSRDSKDNGIMDNEKTYKSQDESSFLQEFEALKCVTSLLTRGFRLTVYCIDGTAGIQCVPASLPSGRNASLKRVKFSFRLYLSVY